MTGCVLDSPMRDAAQSMPDARLMVMQRRSETRSYHAVGFLDAVDGGFEFAYLKKAVEEDGFVPLMGFGNPSIRYRRRYLFPLFAERVISARRPDRLNYLRALDLTDDAEPWEILARSGGYRQGDSIEVLKVPFVNEIGHTTCTFLVHGVRYRGEAASNRITSLWKGEPLQLLPEPTNEWNPRAVLVVSDGINLGYVPDPLVDYMQSVLPGGPSVTVAQANRPEAGPHMRLLVRVEGQIDGPRPFEGEDWKLMA